MMRSRFDSCLDGLLPGDGGAVLLAVSGGIDSMAMADLFLGSRRRLRLAVAHCNFHLRGEESDGDEAFVREWAEGRGIPFLKADFATSEYAASNGISVEMAARELRYSWFASVCSEQGFDAVAVAHNANDNAETLILNLLRGTGLKGLCGMRASGHVPGGGSVRLIRPLLGFSREEIHEYALARGLSWREDSTNSDSAYKRNLIRNEIFPLFAKVNPSFLNTLTGDMGRFAEAQAIADDYFAHFVAEVAVEGGSSTDRLPGQGAKRREVEEPPSTAVEVTVNVGKLKGFRHWKYLLYRLMEPYGFNQATIGDLSRLIEDDSATFSGRRFYSGSHVAETSRGAITISSRPFDAAPGLQKECRLNDHRPFTLRFPPSHLGSEASSTSLGLASVTRLGREAQGGDGLVDTACTWLGREAQGEEGTVDAPNMQGEEGTADSAITVEGEGEYSLDGIRFTVELVEVEDPRTEPGTTLVNLGFPFTVRHWKEGDWMRPLGMNGRRKKLSDMFADLKFSRTQKERALVIADEGSHVLALLGHRIGLECIVDTANLPFDGAQGPWAVRIRLI